MAPNHDTAFYSALLAQHQYALVDREVASEDALKGLPLIPLIPDELEGDVNAMPALLPFGPKATYMERLAVSMKAGETDPRLNPVSTLIVVSPSVKQKALKDHLVSRLIVTSPQGRTFLRYYSSDIFPHLVRILSPARLKSLFGPLNQVQRWTYRFQSDWITIPAPKITVGVPRHWNVFKDQREALDLVTDVNKVLDTYREKMGRPWKDHLEWEGKIHVAELSVDIARRIYHLRAPEDFIAFAMQALTHDERFYIHPTIQNILLQTASSPGAYHNATCNFTSDEWAGMIADLSSDTRFFAK